MAVVFAVIPVAAVHCTNNFLTSMFACGTLATVATTRNDDQLAIHIYTQAADEPITLGPVAHHLDGLT